MAIARLSALRRDMDEAQLKRFMRQIETLTWIHDERPAPTSPEFENTWEDQRRRTTVSCWHKNTTESDAMWFRYASTGNGVAIKSNVGQLRRSLGGDMDVFIGPVTYRDYRDLEPKDFPYQNTLLWMLSKDKNFEHEREVRAICMDSVRTIGGVIDVQPWWSEQQPGHPVPVDLDMLISEIVVSPTTSREFFGTVRRTLETYSLQKPVGLSSSTTRPEFFPNESAVKRRIHEICMEEQRATD